MENNFDPTYKHRDAGNKELFSMIIYRPLAKIIYLKFAKNLNITPNQISVFSLLITIIGAWFFAFSVYPVIIWGVFFVHLGYVFDMLDGQYARYKGLASKYGQWFDPFIDLNKAAFIMIALSYGAYKSSNNPLAFVWGMVAFTNTVFTYYIMNTRGQIIKGHSFEVKFKKNIYIGYEIVFYYMVSFFVIINKTYAGLIFLSTVGIFSWIKVFATLRKYYYTNKTEIENEV